jgi:hypothetical protein
MENDKRKGGLPYAADPLYLDRRPLDHADLKLAIALVFADAPRSIS